MENTPTGRADDLPTIFGFFKKYSKSRSVNIFSPAGFCPRQYKKCYLPAKAPPSLGSTATTHGVKEYSGFRARALF